jgi:asparagine synthase (glutamine-hydrolysing)
MNSARTPNLLLGRHWLSRNPGSEPQADANQWLSAVAASDMKTTAAQADGGFAVGITDGQGRTHLAVDRFAIETLCYKVDAHGQIQFAERADTLADDSTPIDPQAIFDYLYFHCIPSPRTIFKGIYRLPPGHCAVFENGQLRIERFWLPTFAEPAGGNYNALKDEFRSILDAAVKRQLDGSRPACFLSGGTDSSTVAGVMAKVTGEAPASYSIGFDAEGYDEMEYARLAAKRFGTEHHEYYVTPNDLVQGIAKVAGHFDQPFGNSSALPAYYCARFAREQGITRLLAGDGGDELFGGNSRYATQRLFGWYGKLPSALRSSVLEPLFPPGAYQNISLLRKGSGYISQAKVPMPDRLQQYNLLRRLGIDQVLTPGFLAQVNVDDVLAQQRGIWAESRAQIELNRTLAYDWRYTLAESDLPKVRCTTQLADVAVGFPLLDNALLDFSMRLPASYKLKGFKLRWFFKEALRGFLPDEIITKKKHGFGLPFGVWVTRDAPLKKLVTESLHSLRSRGIVNDGFITQLLEQYLPEHPGYYGEMVWILMMLEQWLGQHAPQFRLER